MWGCERHMQIVTGIATIKRAKSCKGIGICKSLWALTALPILCWFAKCFQILILSSHRHAKDAANLFGVNYFQISRTFLLTLSIISGGILSSSSIFCVARRADFALQQFRFTTLNTAAVSCIFDNDELSFKLDGVNLKKYYWDNIKSTQIKNSR